MGADDLDAAEAIEDTLASVTGDAPLPDAPTEERDRWVIDGNNTAEWAMRKLTRIAQRRDQVEDLYAVERDALDNWRAGELAALDRDQGFFEVKLREYHEAILADEPKRKTLSFPAGKHTAQRGSVRVEVTDAQKFADWCDENVDDPSELVKLADPEPKKAEVAKRFGAKVPNADEAGRWPAITDEGEVVPGVELVREEAVTYKAKPA